MEIPERGSVAEINALIEKVTLGLEKEEGLIKKLHETLKITYRAVYQSNIADEEASLPEDLRYAYKIGNSKQEYFVKGQYLPDISDVNIKIAETLISTSEENLIMVEARLGSHRVLLAQLEKMRVRRAANEKAAESLALAASQLEELQQMNTGEFTFHKDLEQDTALLNELSRLTDEAIQADSLEKSLALKEHIRLFQQELE